MHAYDLVPQWSTTVKMWSVKLALYIVWEEGGGGGGLNRQVLRCSILCICKLPNLQLVEQSLLFLQNQNWSLVLSIFCFSLKVLSQGLSGGNPQSPALIDSTERAHLVYCHYPLDGMLFPCRVNTSNDYVAGSINTPIDGENQCRSKILL